jgi:transketolase
MHDVSQQKEIQGFEALCRSFRRKILILCEKTDTGHLGSSFSVVEILATLQLKIMQGSLTDFDRDRLILSKGHASAALYAILLYKGWISASRYSEISLNGTTMGHHPHYEPAIGLDANTGSLGHGLSIGAGVAYNCRFKGIKNRVFVVMSDGETNEGSVWEAAAFAAHHKLSRLCTVIDANKIQALGNTEDILGPMNLAEKWRAFGWDSVEIDGHDLSALMNAFSGVNRSERPLAIVAHTIKGKGVSFMENNLLWHYRIPKGSEFAQAMKELGDA